MTVRRAFRLIESGVADGRRQIAYDAALTELHAAGKVPDTVRFMRFPPTVLVGRHQILSSEVHVERCRAEGVGLVRRVSGGGAIYLDEGQVGWELVAHRTTLGLGTLGGHAQGICEAVAAGLAARFGVPARFRPRKDIEVDGRKIGGTGGYFVGDTLVYQGTVLIDMDAARMARLLNIPAGKLARHDAGNAIAGVVTLQDLLGRLPSIEEVHEAVLCGLADRLGIQTVPAATTNEEISKTDLLLAEEIGTDAFVLGLEGLAGDLEEPVLEAMRETAGGSLHSYGAQNIRTAAMIQLLCGNIGVPGGGVNALRGHANVQGLTDMGTLSGATPGYMTCPNDKEVTLDAYMANRNFAPLQAGQVSFWQNYKKFFVSFLKSMYGDNAKVENAFGFDYLPKFDGAYDVMRHFELMHQGKVNGYICQGFNPLMSAPNKNKTRAALSKLKFLVSIDPLETDTVKFWENHGEANPTDPSKIQTEVFMLPSTCFAEDEGTFTNSSRTTNWRWKAADVPGEARTDIDVMADLFTRLRDLYAKGGGKGAETALEIDWSYKDAKHPTADELLREINGRVLADVKDPTDATKILVKAGEQLGSFVHMRDDGSTKGACWIYTGCYTEKGNLTARRDNADPTKLGVHGNWGFAWPANRRVLYNRASADPSGKPWSEAKKYVYWDETAKKWTGADVPDYGPTLAPEKNAGPFIMNPEGVSRLWVRKLMADGPFPEHFEPFESPVANVLHPKTNASPVARVFKGDLEAFGNAKDFPYVATTYRLVEHFHWWTKCVKLNAIVQPEFFVEISPELAKEKGITNGQMVKVSSNRGSVKGKAVVTMRIPALKIDGKTVHTVGLPLHFGFVGETKKAIGVNSLTPVVGDANTNAPEYKAFLVDIEPVTGKAIS